MHSRWTLCASLIIGFLLTGCLKRPARNETVSFPRLKPVELGTIGIVATSTVPKLLWQAPPTKAIAGQRYAAAGFCLGSSDTEATRAFLHLTCGIGTPLVVAAAVTGGVLGTVQAPLKSQLEPADAAIFNAVQETELQESLRAEVLHRATGMPGKFVMVQKPFPPGQEKDYRRMASMMCATLASLPRQEKPLPYLKSQGINTALEVDLQKTSLEGKGDLNPALRLTIAGVARVIDVRTGYQLASRPFSFSSPSHRFVKWGGKNADLLRSELRKAYTQISSQIVDQLFSPQPAVGSNNELIAANVASQ
ncbi:MAG: hypothetical protein JWM68_1241 [Verrucomicrobiales bacterium]|nr:hypothetical protein [Verrucomicrobiales bacterium]